MDTKHKYIEKRQDPKDKNIKALEYILDNDLMKYPAIARLADIATQTGDFRELDHYMVLNKARFNAFDRSQAIEASRTAANPFYSFPSGEELSKLSGSIKLGIINSSHGRHNWMSIDPEYLTRHTLVMGGTGTGKTVFNSHFLVQLINNASQTKSYNVVLFDPKLSYRRMICSSLISS